MTDAFITQDLPRLTLTRTIKVHDYVTDNLHVEASAETGEEARRLMEWLLQQPPARPVPKTEGLDARA